MLIGSSIFAPLSACSRLRFYAYARAARTRVVDLLRASDGHENKQRVQPWR
jgi:hypothetical protein